MEAKNISIADFSYELPAEKIAFHPLSNRDDSRLLIYDKGNISENRYKELYRYIPSESLLVINNTKVVEARLIFQKASGAFIEIFCLEPGEKNIDPHTAMLAQGRVIWKCLVGGFSKWKAGQILEKKIVHDEHEISLHAKYAGKIDDAFMIEFSWDTHEINFAEILHLAGAIPLPPYIKRKADETDKERYQTVFAKHDGSVAAPTASLHFTTELLNALKAKRIAIAEVTLHVGAGTFKPVKSATMEDHPMHAEFISVERDFIEQLVAWEGKIIATGTTTLRTLETLYWLGVKIHQGYSWNLLLQEGLTQWEPYELKTELPYHIALGELISAMKKENANTLVTQTQLLITPVYKCKIVDGLITNFHQPQSTLLLLIASFIGDDWRKVYQYALEHDFRFLSYGDGSLLWRNQ